MFKVKAFAVHVPDDRFPHSIIGSEQIEGGFVFFGHPVKAVVPPLPTLMVGFVPEKAKLVIQQEHIQPFRKVGVSAVHTPCQIVQRKFSAGDPVIEVSALRQASWLLSVAFIAQPASP